MNSLPSQTEEYKNAKKQIESLKFSHAHLIESDVETARAYLGMVLKLIIENSERVSNLEHPDIQIYAGESFLTKDLEQMLDLVPLKPIEAPAKAFIIFANGLSAVVQNKLLKTLEEPPQNTYIFIVAKNKEGFLPTVLSRTNKISLGRTYSSSAETEMFTYVISTLSNMQKSSQVLKYSRNFGKLNKDKLGEILDMFEQVFERLISLRGANATDKQYAAVLKDEGFSLNALAKCVVSLKKAKDQNMYNVNPNGVYDLFLLSILENKFLAR